jgi:regulator of replication initiation timing
MPVSNNKDLPRRRPPSKTVEGREDQLISLAIDLAERQMIEGTASSQVISHYLKLGSTKDRLEKEIMEQQKQLLKAKTDALNSSQNVEKLYKEAMRAMQTYSGSSNTNEDEEDD